MTRLFAFGSRTRAKEEDLDPDLAFPKGLKVFASPNNATIDIVFVHGLTGDRERTWTSPPIAGVPGPCWPKDWLPSQLPTCRIMTFGYDAYVARIHQKIAQNRLYSHSADLLNALVGLRNSDTTIGRPIIFVTHSMGGIVCKDALRASRDAIELYLQDAYKSVRGVIFLATPHAGSWLADWAKLPAKILGLFRRTDKNLLSILETESEVLRRVHNSFLNLLRAREILEDPILITCFFETLPLLGKTLIVDQDSATIPGYNSVSVHADHRNIARFQRENESGFVSIVHLLRTWTLEIGQVVLSKKTLQQLPSKLSQEAKLRSITSLASFKSPQRHPEWHIDPIEEGEIKRTLRVPFMESLRFPGMNMRETYIERAATKTCGWLFETDAFKRWLHYADLESNHGILWIKGKPGSGKSTMLKHLLELLGTKLNTLTPQPRPVLHHFFSARGTELERSEEGLYRTLIVQICHQRPQLCLHLCKFHRVKIEASASTPLVWHVMELRQMLHDCLVRWELQVDIVIDALDECPDEQARDVVHTLADIASSTGKRSRMCWSSRHYPHISITHGLEIFMETFNQLDIEQYVTQKLNYSRLLSSDPHLAMEIVSKANGVFLWTALVTRQLLKAADQGRTLTDIKDILAKTPSDLFEIYRGILASLDTRLKEETLRLLQWVMFSQEPLYIDDLQAALSYSSPLANPSLVDWALSLDRSQSLQACEEDRERHWRYYITERSGGLFELVRSGGARTSDKRRLEVGSYPVDQGDEDDPFIASIRKRKAQYQLRTDKYVVIDEHSTLSLADRPPIGAWTPILEKLEVGTTFVQVIHQSVRDFLLDQHACGVLHADDPTGFVEASHFQLFKACARFLLSSELTCALSMRRARQQWPGQEPKLVVDGRSWLDHAFTSYAHNYIWEHFRRARLDLNPSILSQSEKDLIRRVLKQWWSLEISVSERSLHANRNVDMQEDTSRRYWVQLTQKLVDLDILTEKQALDGRRCAESFHEGFITIIRSSFRLEGRVLELAFIAAANHGLTQEIASFMQRRVHVDCVDLKGDTAIVGATRGGHISTVKLLLSHAADLDSSGIWNETPLFAAARLGELEIASVLCEHNAAIRGHNWAQETAIHIAASHGYPPVIELLRRYGADLDSADQYGDTPLFKAVRANYTNVVHCLLGFKADANHRNNLSNTPLHECARTGNLEIAKALLDNRAEHEAAGWCGTSPLYVAAVHKHDELVRLLIDKGSRLLLASEDGQHSKQSGNSYYKPEKGSHSYRGRQHIHADLARDPAAQQHVRSKLHLAKDFITSVLTEASDADYTADS